MADIPRIKGNISKMIAQNAPESDIDAYLAGEGVSLDQLKTPAAASAPQVGMGEDIAKSIGAGLGNATIGTLGLAGDLTDLGAKGIQSASNYIGDKLGIERYRSGERPKSVLDYIPTSQSIRATVTDPIVAPEYEPKTTVGGYAKTGAEFLPNLIGGPEGLGAKLLTRVAAPAAVSETAGQLTKGTDAEPYARIGGALLGGAGASKLANMTAERAAVNAASPSLAAVKNEASTAYDALTSRNVASPLQQSTLDNLANDITTTLNNKGIRPSTAGSIHNAVAEIKSPATAGAADVADLVAARQNVKSLLSAPDANKAGAFVALNKIEAAIEQASPGTMKSIREADKNYAAVKANEALDKKLARADLRAAGDNSGMNMGNKIRQKVADLLLSSEAKYLSAENKADLEKIVRGTWTQNGMRLVSNMMGGGGGVGASILTLGSAATGSYTGHPELAFLPLGGMGVRGAVNRSVANQAARTAQNIRMRSPLGQQNPLQLPAMSSPALTGLLPAFLARPQE